MKKKKGKKWILFIIVIVIAIVVVLWLNGQEGTTTTNFVETATPHTGSIEEIISISGSVESEEIKQYFAKVNGKVAEIYTETGVAVKAGDMLLSYDMEVMEEALEQARLQYISGNNSYTESLADGTDAQKKLEEAKEKLVLLEQQIKDQKAYVKAMHEQLTTVQTERADAFAKKDFEMQKTMMILQKDPIENADAIAQLQLDMQSNQFASQKVSSTQDLLDYQKAIEAEEEKLAGYEREKAEMEAQKQSAEMGTLTSYQKDNLSVSEQLNLMAYENAQEDYELAKQGMKADFDGIVTDIGVVEGMSIGEGTQLVTLANIDKVKVCLFVSKYDLKRIALGQPAEIEINDNKYTGSITKINKMATPAGSGKMQVGIEVHIDNPDDNIYLGVDAKVRIQADKAEEVLLIPVEALNADKTGDFVYVEENGVAVRKNIVCGISSVEFIEVKEGLTANDKVIVSSLLSLEEGMAVMNMAMPTEQ